QRPRLPLVHAPTWHPWQYKVVIGDRFGTVPLERSIEDGEPTRACVRCDTRFLPRCGAETPEVATRNADRSAEHAYAAHSRRRRFSAEACRLSARNLSGGRVRAHRRLDDRPAADP